MPAARYRSRASPSQSLPDGVKSALRVPQRWRAERAKHSALRFKPKGMAGLTARPFSLSREGRAETDSPGDQKDSPKFHREQDPAGISCFLRTMGARHRSGIAGRLTIGRSLPSCLPWVEVSPPAPCFLCFARLAKSALVSFVSIARRRNGLQRLEIRPKYRGCLLLTCER